MTAAVAVASTARMAPAACAAFAAASMSITSQVGLSGVSIQTRSVLPGCELASSAARLRRIEKCERDAPALFETLEPVARAVIHDIGRHDMAALRHGLEQRGDRRHAGGKQQAALAVLRARRSHPRHATGSDCRCGCNFPQFRLIVLIAGIGRGGIDRRHHRARCFVDRFQRMGGDRLGPQPRVRHAGRH